MDNVCLAAGPINGASWIDFEDFGGVMRSDGPK
jgi:hypothetical protein